MSAAEARCRSARAGAGREPTPSWRAETVPALALQSLKSRRDLLLCRAANGGQRQTWRTAVVAVEVHRVFQPRDPVSNGNQARGVRDPTLPIGGSLRITGAV